MWPKPERTVVPASSTNHISIDNLNFALALRKSLHREIRCDTNVLPIEDIIDDTPKKKHQQKPCKLQACLHVEQEIVIFQTENQELLVEIRHLHDTYQEEKQILISLDREFEFIGLNERRLSQKLANVQVDIDDLTHRLDILKREKRTIEEEIFIARRQLQSLRNSGTNHHAHGAILLPVGRCEARKHNGSFSSLQTGFAQWSCCLATRLDAPGCIEDGSIDLRSGLGNPSPVEFHIPTNIESPVIQHFPVYAFGATLKQRNRTNMHLPSGSRKVGYPPSFLDKQVGKIRTADGDRRIRIRPMTSPSTYKIFK